MCLKLIFKCADRMQLIGEKDDADQKGELFNRFITEESFRMNWIMFIIGTEIVRNILLTRTNHSFISYISVSTFIGLKSQKYYALQVFQMNNGNIVSLLIVHQL